MTISVVIAAYNAEQFIAETLNSILAQTTLPDEVIVVDDGSTDRTADIAESFGPPVRVFRQPNRRQGAARNFGVSQAIGEMIAFLDSDDLWSPDKLGLQVEEFRRHPDADLCYTGHVNFRDIDGKRQFDPPWEPPATYTSFRNVLLRQHFLPSAVLVRRSAFLNMGGFALNFKVCEDTDFFLRLCRSGAQFVCCPQPLMLYRLHGGNVSKNEEVKLLERKAIFTDQVVPYLRGMDRLIAPRRFYSYIEGELAYGRRDAHDPSCLGMMAKSIALWPFGEATRYKVALHMLMNRLGFLRTTQAAEER